MSEYYKAETDIDAIIYRQEFERHEREYRATRNEPELILSLICLQIYAECFLHQNMRRVIDLEFKPPRDGVVRTWEQRERDYVPEKLGRFLESFFAASPAAGLTLVQVIGDNLKRITYIRNLFVHGRKVAAWSDSDGASGATEAKSLLTEAQLNLSKQKVNELGMAWNDLLTLIEPECRALRSTDPFKFQNL